MFCVHPILLIRKGKVVSMARGWHLKGHVSRDGVFQDRWPGKMTFTLKRAASPE